MVAYLGLYQFLEMWICWLDFHASLCCKGWKCSGQQLLLKMERGVYRNFPYLLVAATLIIQHFSFSTLSLLQLFPLLLYSCGRNFTTPLLLGGKIHCPLPSRESMHLPSQCLWHQWDETVTMLCFVKDTVGHSASKFLYFLDSSPALEGQYWEFLWWGYVKHCMLENNLWYLR